MLLKLYNKSKLWFALGFIIAYCLLMSVGDSVSELIQIQKSVTVPVAAALSALLLLFLHKNSLLKEYGLTKSQIGGKKNALLPARFCYAYGKFVVWYRL